MFVRSEGKTRESYIILSVIIDDWTVFVFIFKFYLKFNIIKIFNIHVIEYHVTPQSNNGPLILRVAVHSFVCLLLRIINLLRGWDTIQFNFELMIFE